MGATIVYHFHCEIVEHFFEFVTFLSAGRDFDGETQDFEVRD